MPMLEEAAETLARCPRCQDDLGKKPDQLCPLCQGSGLVAGKIAVGWTDEAATKKEIAAVVTDK